MIDFSSTSSSNLASPPGVRPHPVTFPCRSRRRRATGDLQHRCRLHHRACLHRRPNMLSPRLPMLQKGTLTSCSRHRRPAASPLVAAAWLGRLTGRCHGHARCPRWAASPGQIRPKPPGQAEARQAMQPFSSRPGGWKSACGRNSGFPHFPYFILTSEISSNLKNP
jgi:hypothetical protein